LVYVALLPLGVNPEDSDSWTYAWLYAVPSGFLSLAVLTVGSLGGSFMNLLQRR
jgi:hypothetical protein